MRLKRWISGLCAAVLCLGCAGGVCALTPPGPTLMEYDVTQPSGEMFKVETNNNGILDFNPPPFESGDIVFTSIGEDNYRICLGDDGYWYYAKYEKVVLTEIENPENKIEIKNIQDWETYWMQAHSTDIYSIQYIFSNESKYLIDPLPSEVWI